MNLHLVYIYRNNQNMIAIVAVDHIFSHEWKNSIFISRQQWTNVRKGILLLLHLNHVSKKYLQKEKTGRVVCYGDKHCQTVNREDSKSGVHQGIVDEVRLVYERRQVIGDRRPQIAVVRK
jgi:hypothetical protein